MIASSSMSLLLADSRRGRRSGLLPRTLLVIGSAASLAANVAVAEPSAVGRLIAAWPSLALIGSYELLMRQVRHASHPTMSIRSYVAQTDPTSGDDLSCDPFPPEPTTERIVNNSVHDPSLDQIGRAQDKGRLSKPHRSSVS
jgi:hypothetical protein